jgi:glycosyltransferase involved in cell wall biosynthesis
MKNFVSIIIPTYNEEKNLENTLKAIRNQDYKKYEIIVSDSKSKDKTRIIAKKYHAKVVVDGRKGIAAGRNFGAKFAKGDILLFLDADTVMMMNTVNEIVQSFSRTKAVGVTCPIIPLKPTVRNLAVYLFFNKFSETSIKSKHPYVAGICVAYRKKQFFSIGGFDEKLAAAEDLDMSRRISKLGKIIYNNNTFVLTSPRRIERWGHLRSTQKYSRLFLKYLIGMKISMKEYEPVR